MTKRLPAPKKKKPPVVDAEIIIEDEIPDLYFQVYTEIVIYKATWRSVAKKHGISTEKISEILKRLKPPDLDKAASWIKVNVESVKAIINKAWNKLAELEAGLPEEERTVKYKQAFRPNKNVNKDGPAFEVIQLEEVTERNRLVRYPAVETSLLKVILDAEERLGIVQGMEKLIAEADTDEETLDILMSEVAKDLKLLEQEGAESE